MSQLANFPRFMAALALAIAIWQIAAPAQTTTYYVRKGATGAGNGSDWANAYTTLPATLQRGATYYVATGTYGEYMFDDAHSGTTRITIKKAIVADHGTSTGWQDSYGIGQAQWTAWDFATAQSGYYTFDGQSRSADWTSGYGIKIGPPPLGSTSNRAVDMFLDDEVPHNSHGVIFRYVEIQGAGLDNPNHDDCVESQNGNNNVTIQYSFIHDCGRTFLITGNTTGWLVEYNLMRGNSSDPAWHGEAWSLANDDNLTVRYNRFEDFEGTGGLVAIGARFDGVNSNWEIYGNTFAISPGNPYNRDDGLGDGIIAIINSGATASNLKFYNNTILNFNDAGGFSTRLSLEQPGSSDIFSYNNFWWNSRNANPIFNSCTNCITDYNRYDNTPHSTEANPEVNASAFQSTFVNYLSKDYRLAAATLAGTPLASPHNLDLTGRTRGADGIWDRGAFEYAAGSTTALQPPTLLRIIP